MKNLCKISLLLFFLHSAMAFLLQDRRNLGLEEGETEAYENHNLDGEYGEVERGDEVDPRLNRQHTGDQGPGPYACSSDLQCANGGRCVATPVGNICNCTQHHLGPFCDYSASSIEHALRIYPSFKISFADCMTKAGTDAGIDTSKVLSKCGGGQNLCWLEEGGIKGLKCFYWCLTNGMHLSLSEAKPSEESRLQLYADVFQKLARERELPERQPMNRPAGVPIYSMQISLYDTSQTNYPFPRHNNIGLPEISIKPSVLFWANPQYAGNPYVSIDNPYDPYSPNRGEQSNPLHPANPPFEYPKSHEIPTPSPGSGSDVNLPESSDLEEFLNNFHNDPYGPEFPGDSENHPQEGAPPGTPGSNFLDEALHGMMVDIGDHNVVESDGDEESSGEELFDSYASYPFHEPFSNMRGVPLIEGDE